MLSTFLVVFMKLAFSELEKEILNACVHPFDFTVRKQIASVQPFDLTEKKKIASVHPFVSQSTQVLIVVVIF